MLVIALLSVGVVRSMARDPEVLGLAPFRHPVEAAEVLAKDPPGGNIFNSVRYGGYLIWRLYPEHCVFIDGRLVIRPREAFRDYLRLLDEPGRFCEYQERFGLTRAVLPTAGVRRYTGLVRLLYDDPAWRLVYANGASALFALEADTGREGLDLSARAAVDGISAELDRRWRAKPYVLEAAKRNLGALLLTVRSYERAAEVLGTLPSAESRRYLARAYYLSGRTDEALAVSRALLDEDAADTNSLGLIGQIHLDRGDVQGALSWFRRTLEIDPYNRHALGAVGEIEAELARRGGPARR
jgi:tetratricopeptide (TPR) repeat protein